MVGGASARGSEASGSAGFATGATAGFATGATAGFATGATAGFELGVGVTATGADFCAASIGDAAGGGV